ncbi:putative metalloprotease [Tahibacter aquaticus]|uniref:Putative metalloprotease n=1 Tax=Tahibacter aquaticus TaxID=520092 RepID=A0A4R6ZAX6_9GAMM|nr:M48 family metallopeptidase [Tahibacter aquaticus]TDR48859.1 putative metalloprotease [Tahibacter aquaticus]
MHFGIRKSLAAAVALLLLATLAQADDKKGLGLGGLLGGKKGGSDNEQLLDAGADAMKGLSLSDADVAKLGAESAKAFDAKNTIAGGGDKYTQRLARLTSGYGKVDGLSLNYKVYLSPTVNAFALPDGSIRVYSGLMDLMSDDEIRFVIGHEIGHVKNGHAKARFKTAYLTQAARKGVASRGNAAGAVAQSELGGIVENVIKAQHSQKNELESDQYGLNLLKRNKVDLKASVSSMQKLGKLGGGKADLLSSHPASAERVKKLEAAIGKG